MLTGGASAVYGADAVAGVVNFVLKTHFEGVQVDAGYNFYQHHNGDQDAVAQYVSASGFPLPSGNVDTGFGRYGSIIAGSNFADNRGNATAYLTYNNQGSALQSSYDYSACSLGVTTLPSGIYGLTCAGSSTSARNGAGGDIRVPNAAGHLVQYTIDGTNNTMRPFTAADLYNFGPLNYYLNPSERWTAGGFLSYELNSHMTFYSSVMYMRNSVNAQIAPSGAFSITAAFIPCADPLLNASELAVICPGGVGNSSETYNGVTYSGSNVGIGRRNVEGGDRTFEARNDSVREVAGLKGDFAGSGAWTYNVYAQHSTVDNADYNANYTSNTATQEALNVLPVGANGAAVCGGPTGGYPLIPAPGGTGFAVDKNCVPWNLWKAGGVTPAALAFISLPLTDQGSTQEYVTDGSITGDLGQYGLKLPSADSGLQVNVGAEWRQDTTNFLPDYEEQQGNGGGVGGKTVPIAGGFHVAEGFMEARLPIASNLPGSRTCRSRAAIGTRAIARASTPTPSSSGSSGRRYATCVCAAASSAPCARRTSASCTHRRPWAWTARKTLARGRLRPLVWRSAWQRVCRPPSTAPSPWLPPSSTTACSAAIRTSSRRPPIRIPSASCSSRGSRPA